MPENRPYCQDPEPKPVFLHKNFAWCLLEELIEDNMISASSPYWQAKRAAGLHENWLTKTNRLRALQILVFAEKVLMPAELDAPWFSTSLGKEGHATWPHEPLYKTMLSPCRHPRLALEASPFIRAALKERGHKIRKDEYADIIDMWEEALRVEESRSFEGPFYTPFIEREVLEKVRRKRAQQGAPEDDIRRIDRRISRLEKLEGREGRNRQKAMLIEEEFRHLQEVTALSEYGIPAFGYGAKTNGPTNRDAGASSPGLSRDEDAVAVLGIYFHNAIRCPAPESLKQALTLRQNESVAEWRRQMWAWSSALSSGNVNVKAIRKEIREANGYIEGARFPSRVLPWYSMFITLPAAAAAQLAPELQELGFLLLGLHGVQLYGEIVHRIVERPDRLNYKWLMLADSSPSAAAR